MWLWKPESLTPLNFSKGMPSYFVDLLTKLTNLVTVYLKLVAVRNQPGERVFWGRITSGEQGMRGSQTGYPLVPADGYRELQGLVSDTPLRSN